MTKKKSRKYNANKTYSQPAGRAKQAPVEVKDKTVELAEEYRYVLGDLKRIGFLAAGMFALLVVLALVIG